MMPLTTAAPLLKSTHHASLLPHARPTSTNGSYTGAFALKNDSGYVPLGTFSGTFTGDMSGEFNGVWTLDDESATGTMNGWYWGYIFIGQMNTDGMNESHWFGGLYRVNETDNSFEAVAIILGNNDYMIRYAMGTLQ